MRFLTADYLFTLEEDPIEKGVLQISNQGEVINIFSNKKDFPQHKLESYDGILCPGFINAHCHLELSHLRDSYKKGSGIIHFIKNIKLRNEYKKDYILDCIKKAEKQLLSNGVVGLGDVCNTSHTINIKQQSNMQYYNFIEAFSVYEDKLNEAINIADNLRKEFRENRLQATIVPHSPYSVHPFLLSEILNRFDHEDKIMSIHLQESSLENDLFEKKKGELLSWLKNINSSNDIWEKRNRAVDAIKDISHVRKLLVHNTFSRKADVLEDAYYCTCPKSNLYIEKRLPDYSLFNSNMLCVGTDSLASNNSLSILEEIYTIQEHTDFDLNTLLKISSKNGAEALGFNNLGSFKKGKKPGVILIQNLKEMKLLDVSTVRRLY